jgi:transcriptional regulator with XRE-family HTH domain
LFYSIFQYKLNPEIDNAFPTSQGGSMSKMLTDLGGKLRRIRKQAGLTLNELAQRCGCSKSLISQIETGAVNPSLSSITNICEALGITLGSLFEAPDPEADDGIFIMRPAERKTLTTEGGVGFQLLSKGLPLPCEFIMNRWPPGGSTGGEAYRHGGQECGILLEGRLIVEAMGKTYEMSPGDTVTFDSSLPHRISNPGPSEAVAIWLNTEPFLFAVT